MNSLFTSSWAKNVAPNPEALWNHEFKEVIVEKRGRAAHPAYAKLMGMESVKKLKGTMTPRYFVTKVLKQIQTEHPNKKIEDVIKNITDEDIEKMMNLTANLSRKLQMKPDIRFSAAQAVEAPAVQKFKEGENATDTLAKNLDATTKFEYEKDVGDNSVYNATHNGIKYRVTVRGGEGKTLMLSDVLGSGVISLQVIDPSGTTSVESPQTGGKSFGDMKRPGKLLADFPYEGGRGEDWSGEDPEETGGHNVRGEDEEEDGNEFSGALAAAKASGKDTFNVGGKEFHVNGEEDCEYSEEDENEEDCEGMPKIVVIKMSPQAKNKAMLDSLRAKRRHMFGTEMRHGNGPI